MLLAPPAWPADSAFPAPDGRGMSLLMCMPALLMLAFARRNGPLALGAWLALLLLLVPLMLYYNTGWRQFGYRFSLDFVLPVIVLLATAAGRRMPVPMLAAIGVGIVVNAWGTWWWFAG